MEQEKVDLFKENRYITFGLAAKNLILVKENYYEMVDHLGLDQVKALQEALLSIMYESYITKVGMNDHWDHMIEEMIKFNKNFV